MWKELERSNNLLYRDQTWGQFHFINSIWSIPNQIYQFQFRFILVLFYPQGFTMNMYSDCHGRNISELKKKGKLICGLNIHRYS